MKIRINLLLTLFVLLNMNPQSIFAQTDLPEGAIFRLGKSTLHDMAYSPDGNILAVGGSDGIWFYDAYTGEEITVFRAGWGNSSIAFSPDGQTIAGNYFDKVRLWDVATMQQKAVFRGHQASISSIAFSPDGQTIAGGDDAGTLYLWDVATIQQKAKFKDHSKIISSIAFSPDSRLVASSSIDEKAPRVVIRNTVTKKRKRTLRGNRFFGDIAFSPDGKTLAASAGWTVVLWDVATGKQHTIISSPDLLPDIAFSPDGQMIAGAGFRDGTLILWDVATGEQKTTFSDNFSRSFGNVAFSPDGQTIAGGDAAGTLILWDVATGEQKIKITGHIGSFFQSLAFSPRGDIVASGERSLVRLWDVTTGKELSTRIEYKFPGSPDNIVYSLAFSPDGNTLASGTSGTIQLWDLMTGNPKVIIEGDTSGAVSLAFSPDGTTLASSGRHKTIHLWNPITGNPKAILRGHTDRIPRIVFSPDGKTLASASRDKTVRLWNPQTGKQKTVLKGHTDRVDGLAFSPDGGTLASGSRDGTLRLWNPETGQQKAVLRGQTQPGTAAISSLAFSPDGTTLAGGSGHGPVLLWDTSPYQQKTVLKGHTDFVFGLAFSPDGRILASGSGSAWSGGTIFLWEFTPRTLYRVSGNNQSGAANSQLRNPFVVAVLDENDEPAAGVQVTFRVTAGEGSLSATNRKTDSNGRAQSFLTLGDSREVNRVAVNVAGASDPVTFTARLEPQVLVAQSQRPPMYWIDTHINAMEHLTGAKVKSLTLKLQNATGFAVDVARGEIYWTEQTSDRTGRIRSANLNGSGIQLVKELTSVPHGIAVDAVNAKLYLTNSWGKVQRLNLDGSGFQGNLITGLDTPKHIAVDTAGRKIYWTEQTSDRTGRIRSANLNGSGIQLVKELTSVPHGIAVDAVNAKLYLTNSWGKVQRLNLDGSDFQGNLITGLDAPKHIAVDTAGRKIYWTEPGKIRRADFNGQNIQNIVTGLGTPSHIALGTTSGAANPAAPAILTRIPKETRLLSNYPNPCNPETWIPYQLAAAADVGVLIYATDGKLVRTLKLGQQAAGVYQSRSRAAYWDGKNEVGEAVASGLYFYTLTADDFAATRKMLVRK